MKTQVKDFKSFVNESEKTKTQHSKLNESRNDMQFGTGFGGGIGDIYFDKKNIFDSNGKNNEFVFKISIYSGGDIQEFLIDLPNLSKLRSLGYKNEDVELDLYNLIASMKDTVLNGLKPIQNEFNKKSENLFKKELDKLEKDAEKLLKKYE